MRTATAPARARGAHALRLLPVAAAAWAAAAAATFMPHAAWVIAVALWTGCGLSLIATAVRPRRAVVVVAVALAVGGAAASHVALEEPARRAAADIAVDGGRAVSVDATVTGKVDAGGDWLRFDATAHRVDVGPDGHRLDVPIVVWADPGDVARDGGLDVGAGVRIEGVAHRAEPGQRAALEVTASRGLTVTSPPGGLLEVASALRAGLVRASTGLPGSGAELIPGLAVGDTSAVTESLDTAMKTASLSHLTAVSGANCAIVVGLAFGAAALAGASRLTRIGVATAALAGFVLLVTPEPSVVRAGVMALIAMTAVHLGRSHAGASALLCAVAVLLAADPWLASSLGFALSVAATAALLVLARPLARGLSRWMPRTLALTVAVPLAAQLACGPLLILAEPAVPVYGVAANLLAAPAAPVATVVGLAACLAGPGSVLQAGLVVVAWLPASWIAATAETVRQLPAPTIPWLAGWPGVATLAALGAGIAVLIGGSRLPGPHAVRGAAAFLVCTTLGVAGGSALLAGPAGALAVPQGWTVAACDVGQGDAMLIRSAGQTMLVDTGAEPPPLERCLTQTSITTIDILVLTHFDLDHAGAAPALIGRVRTVLHGPPGEPADDALLDRFAAAGAHVMSAAAGMSGDLGGARWRVLWPRANSVAYPPGNDSSVVLDVRGGGVPPLLALGDLSASPQRAVAASPLLQPPYTLVKVAHHGSADQDAELYRIAAPVVAVVSVGADNDYGHPRAEALQLLDAAGARIARTDTDGLIVVIDDGGAYRLWRERAPPTAARRRVGGDRYPRRVATTRRSAIPQVSWRDPRPAPVVLVVGPEDVCAERAIARLRDVLRADDPSLEVTDLRADDYAAGTLLAQTSPSLFDEPRLVRVQGVEKASDAFLTEAIAYLAHPQEGATVVLRHTGVSVRGKKLLDAVRAGDGGGVEIACPAIRRDSDRYDFAAAEFGAAGRRIAPAALRALVSAFADDLTELAAACQQLIADVTGDISEPIVARYYGGRVETSAFTVADTAIAGRYGDALVALRHALASGSDPVPLVAAIAVKLRTMARVAGSREPAAALASRLGLKDWQVDRARRDLAGWDEPSLELAIQAAARADAEVKGASRDPVFALERLVTVIATRAPFGAA